MGGGVGVVGVWGTGTSLGGSGDGTASVGTSSFIVAVISVGFSLTGFFGGVGLANLSF